MKKIIGSLLIILLCFSFVTKVRASTVLDINTTDCSGQGGTDNSGSNIASACNNTVDTESGTLLTAWGDAGHPVIHIIADVSDTLYLTVNTPGAFLPKDTYTAVEWTTTLTNWDGWIGGGWFDCNGSWGCPTVTFAPGGGSGWQGTATATGHTDYYIVAVSFCQGVSSGCYTHLTVSCSNCSVAGLTTPPPQPKLTVIKTVINDNGGTKFPYDFTIDVNGVNASPSTFSGNKDGTVVVLSAGEYGVLESTQPDYQVAYSQDCNGSITDGEEKTCTITNDDIAPPPPPTPTPTPVSKVILIPGLGASWNANAFASCSFDDNPEHWSLASYASDIYSPLIEQIKNTNWNLKEFYYDWKTQIQNNSNALANVINSSELLPGEKVNIVGHSMGGLIGMNYLLGNVNKVNGLLAVGSPFKGSVLSYPAWEGGDVWNDNFLAKIATTLFIKHCGNILNTNTNKDTIQQAFPSIGDLLPAFEYLNDFKTGTRISPQYAQSTWPNSNFTLPGGVKVETILGTGFDTLTSISVKSPNKHETGLGLWQDGKPAAKQYSTEGDGTVLAASSRIEGVEDVPLTQTHSGLISSQDGINAILNFLGSAPITSATPTAQTSALVIIGYPSNFLVTDQSGKTQKDKDGMVAFINPKSGSYKLNLIPKTNNTLFVVAQFLPNGEVKYKEYKFNGYGPKFKTLNFSLENPSEDILN